MIEARGIKKRFGAQHVLNGVDLRIDDGEAVAIIGRSGGGKSILLKHLIGLLSPDEGEVLIRGLPIAHLSERQLLDVRKEFGLLFQSAALFDSMTVHENVAFPLRRDRQLTSAEIGMRVDEALAMVDLPGTGAKRPAELSGGMRKRAGLARAIVYRPKVLLYDEPTTGLDPIVSDSIDQLIKRLCEQLRTTTVVVTHDMRSVRAIAQRVLMLHEGKIYANAATSDLFASTDPVVSAFVKGVSTPKDLLL
ncbi:MAG: ATP-binding cassette domain-containing protein [Verrucomicrobia bacterium]|nr:ATP-binding cassette domain-containing protein [Verrucomicrobiota bacterium]MBI3868085.1 ATP-binding cassette domain-containing protein [Verrucomicrobiota bacterium]